MSLSEQYAQTRLAAEAACQALVAAGIELPAAAKTWWAQRNARTVIQAILGVREAEVRWRARIAEARARALKKKKGPKVSVYIPQFSNLLQGLPEGCVWQVHRHTGEVLGVVDANRKPSKAGAKTYVDYLEAHAEATAANAAAGKAAWIPVLIDTGTARLNKFLTMDIEELQILVGDA